MTTHDDATKAEDDSDAPEAENVLDLIFQRLQLPEIYGQVLSNRAILNELLPVLVQSGVLNYSQAEEVLSKAHTNLSEVLERKQEDFPRHAEEFALVKKQALEDIDAYRQTIAPLADE